MNRFQIKLLMVLLMIIDHIGYFLPNTPIWLNYIGRIVAPVFFFLLVDGFFHTSNRYSYAKRLMVAAGIMATGNLLVSILFPIGDKTIGLFTYAFAIVLAIVLAVITWLTYKAYDYDGRRILFTGIVLALMPLLFNDIWEISNNILLPMALSIMMLNAIEYGREVNGSTSNTLTVVGILFVTALTEGSLMISFMVLIFYYFRNDRKMLIISYAVLSLIFAISDLSYQGLFIENYQWMMVFALPFFFVYNGKKGRDVKYLFYVFYPLHIWILYIVGFYMQK
ncbi:MAG: TraX family protein [Caldicoprobacterales bacterium]|nr:hypothetical protein [Clostridiales bacterium]